MSELSLQEIYQHPFVQELVEQNEQLADGVPSTQHLAFSKKINLDNIKVPHLIKNRLLFQEGMHNELFYPYEHLKENIELWNNNDLFMAEHSDASNVWIGLTKNPRAVDEEKAIYGDLELVDKGAAQKIQYQILNKDGRMGISPTIDVNKQMVNNKMCALGPYQLKSQSIVLDPAVKTTIFNSAQNGGATMEPGNIGNDVGNNPAGQVDPSIQNLKKDEVKLKKEELDQLKADQKELADYKANELTSEVEKLADLEVAIGRCDEENLTARKEVLEKLSVEERKVLFDTYGWIEKELSDKSEEEMFLDNLSEENKKAIPPGLRKFIEEEKKKKKEQEMAKMTPEEKKKKEEEDKKNLADKGKKKYPYPEDQKLNEGGPQNLSRQDLSQQNLIAKNDLNRFQNLSDEAREENEEFLDFMKIQQGDQPGGAK